MLYRAAMRKHPPFVTMQPLILASGSPRRRQMLRDLGLDIEVIPVQADESPLAGEQPGDFAGRMAETKALAAAGRNPGSWVIGADTVISLAGTILGKPKDAADAMIILKQLVGTTHQVITGICCCRLDRDFRAVWAETTRVAFIDADEDVLAAYIRTGEPLDKAGAYGVQGIGSFLVSRIEGSCTNVIGLPMDSVVLFLLKNGIIAPQQSGIVP